MYVLEYYFLSIILLIIVIMLEGLVFVIKVISFILKKFWYRGKSKFWKELESGKMEFGRVI